jgi:hypothetical protein
VSLLPERPLANGYRRAGRREPVRVHRSSQERCRHRADARWNRRLRNASPHKGVRRSPIYFGIKRRDRRMLDEIVLDLAPLEGRLRSLGAEVRRLLRATPPAKGRGTTRQPGGPARRGVLALAYDSPILYIHCAYGNERFQDASFPACGAFRQAVGGDRREESRRGRVAARSHGP